MEANRTKPVAGRVSTEIASQLERATEGNDVTTSELVRRAVERYVEDNPDDIPTFYPDDSLAAFVEDLW